MALGCAYAVICTLPIVFASFRQFSLLEVSEELQALSLPSSISTEWRAANKRSKQFGSSEDIHSSSDELEDTVDPLISTLTSGKSSVDTLVLVFHGGSIIETNSDRFAKNVDCQTLQQTFHQIVNKHYQFSKGRIAFRLVACPPICKSAVELMSSVSPIQASSGVAATRLPLELMSIFAVSQPEYQEIVGDVVVTANDVFEEFLQSEEGQNFVGHVSSGLCKLLYVYGCRRSAIGQLLVCLLCI